MKRIDAPQGGQASVYVLQRQDRKRFKVGWARRPLERVKLLPEYRAGELDLAASNALWVDSRPRAEEIERSLQKSLRPLAADTDHQGDGRTEWFDAAAHPVALGLLSRMPGNDRSLKPGRLLPLALPAPPRDAVSIETGPQDVWWALEDLWSRLAMAWPMAVESADGAQRVVLLRFKKAVDGEAGALRRAVLDAETYQSRLEGCWSFVRWIDWRGDDLVCELTPPSAIERWDGGQELAWQVRAFLLRLQRLASPGRGGR